MMDNSIVVTNYYLVCSNCKEKVSTYDHLAIGEIAGPWYCDSCGTGHIFNIGPNGHPQNVTAADTKKVYTLVLLKLVEKIDGQPLYFITKGQTFIPRQAKLDYHEIQLSDYYFYTEHTCPSNWLGINVTHGEDSDPHGLFEHVETIEFPSIQEATNVGIDISSYRYLGKNHHLPISILKKLFKKLDTSQKVLKYIEGFNRACSVLLGIAKSDPEANRRFITTLMENGLKISTTQESGDQYPNGICYQTPLANPDDTAWPVESFVVFHELQ